MGDFCSLADLNSYLLEISPRYGKYAADLWDKNIRSPAQLANVSITHLADCGISNIAHAKTIQAYSAGEYIRQYAICCWLDLCEGPLLVVAHWLMRALCDQRDERCLETISRGFACPATQAYFGAKCK